MKVFLDANILVTILNKEYPLFSQAARVISLADLPGFELFTSPLCLAITWYFAEKKSGRAGARKKFQVLVEKLSIAEHAKVDIRSVLGNPAILDFEDGLEYHAAKRAGCTCIITQDAGDFHFSALEVLSAGDFLNKYLSAAGNGK